MSTDLELRSRISDIKKQRQAYGQMLNALLLLRCNPDFRVGNHRAITDLIEKLKFLRRQASDHRLETEALLNVRINFKDRDNPTTQGLKSTLRHESQTLCRDLERLIHTIDQALFDVGRVDNSLHAVVVVTGQKLEQKFDVMKNRFEAGNLDDLLFMILLVITGLTSANLKMLKTPGTVPGKRS